MKKTSKHQAPSSREAPNSKLQDCCGGCVVFETWNFSGAWSLEFGAF
jgi:hypothetical protein